MTFSYSLVFKLKFNASMSKGKLVYFLQILNPRDDRFSPLNEPGGVLGIDPSVYHFIQEKQHDSICISGEVSPG